MCNKGFSRIIWWKYYNKTIRYKNWTKRKKWRSYYIRSYKTFNFNWHKGRRKMYFVWTEIRLYCS